MYDIRIVAKNIAMYRYTGRVCYRPSSNIGHLKNPSGEQWLRKILSWGLLPMRFYIEANCLWILNFCLTVPLSDCLSSIVCIFFRFLAVKFPSPSSKKLFKCPTTKTCWMGKCPTPGAFIYRLTGQDRFKTICYKYQLAFFILKLDKGTSYLHSKASLSFYGPFLVSHSVTNAISCLLNHFSSLEFGLCANGQILHLPRLGVKFPTPAAAYSRGKGGCQMPVVCPLPPRGDVEVTNLRNMEGLTISSANICNTTNSKNHVDRNMFIASALKSVSESWFA